MSERSSISDERLGAALKALPREQARPGFTGRVLRRLDEDRGRPFPNRWAWMATAAALLALALSFGWRDWQHRQERAETLARLEALLVQKQELEAELANLKRLTADARPVVYLGGNDEVELTLDLARFQRRGGFGSGLPSGRGRDARPPAALPQAGPRPAGPRPAGPRQADLQPRERYETLRVVY